MKIETEKFTVVVSNEAIRISAKDGDPIEVMPGDVSVLCDVLNLARRQAIADDRANHRRIQR